MSKYSFRVTSQFKKDLKLAKEQGKDIDELFKVVNILMDGKRLDEKYCDHNLSGKYKGCRECHINPDWLLIYTIKKDILILILNRVGSHSDLF